MLAGAESVRPIRPKAMTIFDNESIIVGIFLVFSIFSRRIFFFFVFDLNVQMDVVRTKKLLVIYRKKRSESIKDYVKKHN